MGVVHDIRIGQVYEQAVAHILELPIGMVGGQDKPLPQGILKIGVKPGLQVSDKRMAVRKKWPKKKQAILQSKPRCMNPSYSGVFSLTRFD